MLAFHQIDRQREGQTARGPRRSITTCPGCSEMSRALSRRNGLQQRPGLAMGPIGKTGPWTMLSPPDIFSPGMASDGRPESRVRMLIGAGMLATVLVGACSTGTGEDLAGMNATELADEKLREEILDLRSARSLEGRLIGLIPIGTLIVGLAGGAIAYGRFRHDRRIEEIRRVDERFAQVASDLGSESEVVRNGAAVALRTFLRPRYDEEIFEDAFELVMSNLKITEHPESVRRLLAEAFCEGLKRKSPPSEAGDGLDLVRAWLKRAELEGSDLRFADLAWARLDGANLRHSDLRSTRGYNLHLAKAVLSDANLHQAQWQKAEAPGAYFHNTRMVSIDLKHADLNRARFQEAELQTASLQHADLRDANFIQANLHGTHFEDAILNEATAGTIVRGVGWREAHFDPEALELINRAAVAVGAAVEESGIETADPST
jgi:uncharacterized protein YjbI with pentapeptide repeats